MMRCRQSEDERRSKQRELEEVQQTLMERQHDLHTRAAQVGLHASLQ